MLECHNSWQVLLLKHLPQRAVDFRWLTSIFKTCSINVSFISLFLFLPTFRYLWFLTSVLHVPSFSYTFNFFLTSFLSLRETMTWTASGGKHSVQYLTLSTFNRSWLYSDLCLLTAHSALPGSSRPSKYLCFPSLHDWAQTSRQKDRRRSAKRGYFHPPMAFSYFQGQWHFDKPASFLTMASWRHIAPSATPGLAANTISSWLRSN